MASSAPLPSEDLVQVLEEAQSQKELGTVALHEGDVATAQARYEDALRLLAAQGAADRHPAPGTSDQFRLLWQECTRRGAQLELACNLNVALCCIKRELWTQAVDAAGQAVRRDPQSAKAWFRRGVARAGAGQNEEARADLIAAAKLAPKDRAIRRELAVVKNRLAAAGPPGPSAEGSAAVAAALAASGELYGDHEMGLTRVGNLLAKGERALGQGCASDAIELLKSSLRLIQEEENGTFEIAYKERFAVHSLGARCHMAHAERAASLEARATALGRAVADLQKAAGLLDEAASNGRGVGSEPAQRAVASEAEAQRVRGLLKAATDALR
jgi:tetratricopeptide (TPR) repeat protein